MQYVIIGLGAVMMIAILIHRSRRFLKMLYSLEKEHSEHYSRINTDVPIKCPPESLSENNFPGKEERG